jgi:hypothetical protein
MKIITTKHIRLKQREIENVKKYKNNAKGVEKNNKK